MDSKTQWRDVYSMEAWRKILTITGAPRRPALAQIEMELRAYHQVDKVLERNLDTRIMLLKDLATETAIGIVGPQTEDRVGPGEFGNIEKDGHKKYDDRRHGNTHTTNLGPWMASLARRARKKAAYLETIKRFLSTQNGGRMSSPMKFLNYLDQVQQKRAMGDEYMRLTPGDRVERLDPLHRGGAEIELRAGNYVAPTSNPLSQALVDWLGEGASVPFFLWLEDHPICTATPGLDAIWDANLRRVKRTHYMSPSERGVYIVTVRGGKLLKAEFERGGDGGHEVMDTSHNWLVKGEVRPGGQYAFVWTHDGIYSAPHKAGKLHHSSFTSGSKVLAAGMMGVKEGKVTFVDDNTGHYHTDAYHLYAFVEFLNKAGALHPEGVMVSRGVSGRAVSFQRLLTRYQDPAERATLRARINTDPIRVR